VREDERLAASLGITGVPFFVVDRALGVSGAQPVDVLAQMLQQGFDAHAA
jgi:predicted DsbA family dithiol-disulfide isomerase